MWVFIYFLKVLSIDFSGCKITCFFQNSRKYFVKFQTMQPILLIASYLATAGTVFLYFGIRPALYFAMSSLKVIFLFCSSP